jgi:hypothetical protein
VALLWCESGQWSLIGATEVPGNLTATRDPAPSDDLSGGYGVGSFWINTALNRIWMCMDNTSAAAIWKRVGSWANSFRVRAAAATIEGVGILTPTLVGGGGLANANNSMDTFVRCTSSSGGANVVGFATASFDLVRPSSDPVVEILIKTEASSLANRWWIGLSSAASTNVDTLAAGTKFIGFRYSTSAGDSGWRPVLNDGSTQNTGTAIGTVALNTLYKLKIRVDSANLTAYFSVNDGVETALSSHFPAVATDMGLCVQRWDGNGAGSLYMDFSRAEVGW